MIKFLNFELVGRENDYFLKLCVKEMFNKNIYINICVWILVVIYVLFCFLGNCWKKVNKFKSFFII